MSFDSILGSDDPVHLRVGGPDDLLHLVPYLLGFHPTESFVVVGMRAGRVVLTARADLAELPESLRTNHMVRALVRAEAREVIAVVYTDAAVESDPLTLPHGAVVAQFGEAAEMAGLAFLDALVTSRGRWWSYCCAGEDCCLSCGRALDDRAPSPVVAAATVAGLVALPSRADLEALLDPLPSAHRQELIPLLANVENDAFDTVVSGGAQRRNRSLVRALFARARRADAGELALSDDDLARFGVALTEPDIRDSVWLALDERRIDGRDLWRLLARSLPEPYDAAPLFLVGWGAWREGNGTLASIAAQRAVESDPGYTPADLLMVALMDAVDPHRMPRIRPARLRRSA